MPSSRIGRSACGPTRRALTIGCLGLATLLPGCSSPRPEVRTLDFGEALAVGLDRGLPAIAIGVDVPGHPPWTDAAGWADLEAETRVSPSHAFHLASVTKLLTAVATLRLVDRGLLTLDARVVDWISPDVVAGVPFIERITVAHLLDHSSGIYGFNNDLEYLATVIGPRAGDGTTWAPRDLVALAHGSRAEPFGEPGTGHHYGDTNYVLLGLIVEAVTGRPFREHMRSDLLEPLGMSCTEFVSELRAGTAELACPSVEGYAQLSDELVRYWSVPEELFPKLPGTSLRRTTAAGERLDSAAGLMTTAPDLLAFAHALFHGRLLSESSRGRLLAGADGLSSEPVGAERAGMVPSIRLPVGVVLAASGDGPGGSDTLLAWHPDTDAIVVALTNVFGLGDEHDLLLEELAGSIFVSLAAGPGRAAVAP